MTRRARHPDYLLRGAVHRPRSLQARQRQPRSRRRRPAADRVRRAAGGRGAARRHRDARLPATEADAPSRTRWRASAATSSSILLDDIREPDRRGARRRAHPARWRRARSQLDGAGRVRQPQHRRGGQFGRRTAGDECRARRRPRRCIAPRPRGGGGYAVFDAAMHQAALERLRLETELRRAVERQEFRLWYQPIVSLTDRRVVGLRGADPVAASRARPAGAGGVPGASRKRSASSPQIDEWVLRGGLPAGRGVAAQHADRWRPADRQRQPVGQGVRHPPRWSRVVAECLRETGLPARALRLEITESVAIADADRVRGGPRRSCARSACASASTTSAPATAR